MSIATDINKGLKDPKRAIKVIGNKIFSTVGHLDYTPFIILSRSRSGSNLLVSFLNSHPQVFSEAEIFGQFSDKSYQQILNRSFGKQPLYCKAKGFKMFYYHPRNKEESAGVWHYLESMENLHVIHLKRKNVLRTLVSRRIAGIKNNWVARTENELTNNSDHTIKIEFTHDLLREGFEMTRKWELEGDNRFRHHPLISIDYEDLVNNADATFQRITDFLEVSRVKPRTVTKKQGNKSLREIMSNYDELKSSFHGTEWEAFFAE